MTGQTDVRDIAAQLIGPSSEVERARAAKPDVVAHNQAAYDALFETPQVLPPAVLHAFAAIVAQWQGSGALYDWHVAQGADEALLSDAPIPDAKLRVLREHLDLVTVSPALGTHEDQHVLAVSGITPDEIVLVSQLVAYVSNLVRVIAGFTAVAGREVPSVDAPARALASTGRTKNQDPHTITGHEKPTAFTQRQLAWEPWVAAPAEDELTPEQIDSFASKSTTNSVYFRLISRTPAVTKARSALDNAVFLSKEGLPKAERELAAAVASKVNDCIYCASVHARKATFHSKREADVDRLLAQTLPRDENWIATDVSPLSAGQDERWSAIIDAAAKLSELRPTLAPADIDRLRAVGLDDVDIADLIGSTAFFAWANRLMLTLGEPYWPAAA